MVGVIDRGKRNVLGVMVDTVDYAAAVRRVLDGVAYGVSALAVHGVMTGVHDDEHRHRLNSFDLVTPDGQPVRWALNWLYGAGLTQRVYGPELTLRLLAADGVAATIRPCARDAWPADSGRADAVVVGWSGYALTAGRSCRVALLRGAARSLPVGPPHPGVVLRDWTRGRPDAHGGPRRGASAARPAARALSRSATRWCRT